MRRTALAAMIGGVIGLGAGFTAAHAADAPGSASATAAASPQPAPSQKTRQLALSVKPWTGDFDRMLDRRMIRVLVPRSRTLYYMANGRERGVTAELVREWERAINRKYAKRLGKRPLTVYLIPTTREKLISGVADGLGDVAAGNITVTEQRAQLVDFLTPTDLKAVDEIVVASAKAPPVTSVDDLSGKSVHVARSDSYYDSLVALNERFKAAGKPPVNPVLIPDALEDEDKLEMVNAGLLDLVIVDDWVARIWAQVLPGIKLVPGAAVRTGGRTGWAIRKESPKLMAELSDFYDKGVRKQGLVAYLQGRELRRVKQLKNSTAEDDLKRFEDLLALFRKYGGQYNFDPLMLAAQGYQESQLDQSVKSRVGAIGVMQVMPATGEQLKVGDVRVTEPNIHAGAKYLDQLMTRYFPDANLTEGNRPLFAFAAYNAGPANISRMRKLATQQGLDPDKWFNNVEVVTAEKIGMETTTYVRNIYKYYVAYKLLLEHRELQERAKSQLQQR